MNDKSWKYLDIIENKHQAVNDRNSSFRNTCSQGNKWHMI